MIKIFAAFWFSGVDFSLSLLFQYPWIKSSLPIKLSSAFFFFFDKTHSNMNTHAEGSGCSNTLSFSYSNCVHKVFFVDSWLWAINFLTWKGRANRTVCHVIYRSQKQSHSWREKENFPVFNMKVFQSVRLNITLRVPPPLIFSHKVLKAVVRRFYVR